MKMAQAMQTSEPIRNISANEFSAARTYYEMAPSSLFSTQAGSTCATSSYVSVIGKYPQQDRQVYYNKAPATNITSNISNPTVLLKNQKKPKTTTAYVSVKHKQNVPASLHTSQPLNRQVQLLPAGTQLTQNFQNVPRGTIPPSTEKIVSQEHQVKPTRNNTSNLHRRVAESLVSKEIKQNQSIERRDSAPLKPIQSNEYTSSTVKLLKSVPPTVSNESVQHNKQAIGLTNQENAKQKKIEVSKTTDKPSEKNEAIAALKQLNKKLEDDDAQNFSKLTACNKEFTNLWDDVSTKTSSDADNISTKEKSFGDLIQTRTAEIQQLYQQRKENKISRDRLLKQTLERIEKQEDLNEPDIQTLKRMLANRDNRIKQAELVALTRQRQYQELLKELANKESLIDYFKQKYPNDITLENVENKTASQLDYLETEVTAMRQYIDELVYENDELQSMLLQKEKQLNAVIQSVSNDDNEMCALQLSIQAIAMLKSSKEYKLEIQGLEKNLEEKKEEITKINDRYEQVYEELNKKREEAASLMESLASKDLKISKLDTLLHLRDKELNHAQEKQYKLLAKEKQNVANLEAEIKVLQETYENLKKELTSRDDHSINLTSEIVRQSRYNQSAENRIKALETELNETQHHIEKLIKQNLTKDKYVVELEHQLKTQEVHQQEALLQESMRIRQIEDKLQETDMTFRKDCVHETSKITERNYQSPIMHSGALGNFYLENDRNSVQEKMIKSEQECYSNEFDSSYNEEHSYRCLGSRDSKNPTILSPSTHFKRKESRRFQEANEIQNSSRRPNSCDDMIHSTLKRTLKEARWKHLKRLFFRLSNDKYLFGSQRVRLRLNDQNEIEGELQLNSNQWLPFEVFVSYVLESLDEKI